MVFSNLIVFIVVYCALLLFSGSLISAESGHKKVIIHIPMKVKSHRHTHTVYKHIHHGSKVQFKVLGFQQGHDHGSMYDDEEVEEEDYRQNYKYNGPRFWKKYG
ncbi:hypothetical protein ACFFRR_008978 [Megaselia abdita]